MTLWHWKRGPAHVIDEVYSDRGIPTCMRCGAFVSEHTEHALQKGKRVEIAPHYDAWMRGARFGTVIDVTSAGARVSLDKLAGSKLYPFDTLPEYCEAQQQPQGASS